MSIFSRSRMIWPDATLGPTPGSDSAGWSSFFGGGGTFLSSSRFMAAMLLSISMSRSPFRLCSTSTTSLK